MQEIKSTPAWINALACVPQTSKSGPLSSLAQACSAGKLMAALDILTHAVMLSAEAQLHSARTLIPFVVSATCQQLYATATGNRALRSATVQAVVVAMAACCSQGYITLLCLVIMSSLTLHLFCNDGGMHSSTSIQMPLNTQSVMLL